MASTKRDLLSHLTLTDYFDLTASAQPVPGGGSAAALSAALSASLGQMVANLTMGRKAYIHVEADMGLLKQQLETLRDTFQADIDRDRAAYQQVLDAMRLPKDSPTRHGEIQKALTVAAQVPLEVAEHALELITLLEKIVKKGNKNAVTDGMVAVLLARTAALAALMNVQINADAIQDRICRDRLNTGVDGLRRKIIQKEADLLRWYRSDFV